MKPHCFDWKVDLTAVLFSCEAHHNLRRNGLPVNLLEETLFCTFSFLVLPEACLFIEISFTFVNIHSFYLFTAWIRAFNESYCSLILPVIFQISSIHHQNVAFLFFLACHLSFVAATSSCSKNSWLICIVLV